MSHTTWRSLVIGLVIGLASTVVMGVASAGAQTASGQFVPFSEFIQNVQAAPSAQYVGGSQSQVSDASAFEEMRRHVLSLYSGVNVKHSFVHGDQHFDCVPIMQQPSVRAFGIQQIASPPSEPAPGGAAARPGAPHQIVEVLDPKV